MASKSNSKSRKMYILQLGIFLALLFAYGCSDDESPTQPISCTTGPVTCANFQESVRWVGSLLIDDIIENITIFEDYAYALSRRNGLRVIEVSDPTSPVEVSRIGVHERSGFAIGPNGEYAYVGNFYNLTVYSLADPGTLQYLASVDFHSQHSSYPVRLQVMGQYAYVVSADGILKIVDISQPETPVLVSRTATGAQRLPYYLLVVEGMAYLSNPFEYFSVDVSDPQNPIVYNAGIPAIPLENATLVGTHIITKARREARYQYEIWDVTDPLAPIFVKSPDLPVGGKIEVAGDIAVYFASGVLIAVDISDLYNPKILGNGRSAGAGEHLCFGGGIAVSSGGGDSSSDYLAVFDVATPHSLDMQGNWDGLQHDDWVNGSVADWVNGSYAVDEILYLATQDVGLIALDISEPACPSVLATVVLPEGALSLTVSDNILFVAANDGLYLFDISSASAPVEITTIHLLGPIVDVAIADNIAVLLGIDGELHTVSVEDVEMPLLLGSLSISRYPKAVTIDQATAFIATGGAGLMLVDISDPLSPSVLSTTPTAGDALDVALFAGNAIVHDGPFLTVLDVSAPSSPLVLSELLLDLAYHGQMNSACSIHVEGSHVYVSTQMGVDVLDLTSLSEPKILGSVGVPRTMNFTVHGQALFIAGDGELKTYSAHCD